MEALLLTRYKMSELLLSLRGDIQKPAVTILQESWLDRHDNVERQDFIQTLMSTSLPLVFQNLIKSKKNNIGFSLNDVVALSNQIEHTNVSSTTIQNWVKRDVKELIGSPRLGKKYSIEQVATLFIVEDLKTTLDFESIRKLLTLIFNNPEDVNDDLIDPLLLYGAYSKIFEEMDQNDVQMIGVQKKGEEFVKGLKDLKTHQKEAVVNTIVIATLSVQTSYFQSLAKRRLNATLFLQNL